VRAALAAGLVLLLAASGAAEEPDKIEVTVTITDSAANATVGGLFDELTDAPPPADEEAYRKTYTLDGTAVREEYRRETKSGAVSAMIGGRVSVDIEAEGLSPEELRGWLERIDRKRLAEARAASGEQTIPPEKLTTFLPTPPPGWSATPAKQRRVEAAGFPATESSRVYEK
jgi:hypothetical protein